jgi:hypothetical protein
MKQRFKPRSLAALGAVVSEIKKREGGEVGSAIHVKTLSYVVYCRYILCTSAHTRRIPKPCIGIAFARYNRQGTIGKQHQRQ